jgi:hypothetical protein
MNEVDGYASEENRADQTGINLDVLLTFLVWSLLIIAKFPTYAHGSLMFLVINHQFTGAAVQNPRNIPTCIIHQ